MKHIISDISVITAAYNAEKTIAVTIQSIINQEFLPREYIIVDDGSTDRTSEIVDSFSQQYPWIRLISIPNQGVAKARNTAWRESSGSLITVLDADDQYFCDALKNLYEGWLQGLKTVPNPGLVYGNYQIFNENQTNHNYKVVTPSAQTNTAALLQQIFVMNMVLPSTCLYARSALEKVGGWPEETGDLTYYGSQDLSLIMHFAMKYKFIKIEHTICHYRQHENQQNNNQAKLRYNQDLFRFNFIQTYGPQIFFPTAQTPEHLAYGLERLALKLMQRKRKKPIDTALLLLKIADGLAPTAQRKQNIQQFTQDIPQLINREYPGGQRYQKNIDIETFVQRIKEQLDKGVSPDQMSSLS